MAQVGGDRERTDRFILTYVSGCQNIFDRQKDDYRAQI